MVPSAETLFTVAPSGMAETLARLTAATGETTPCPGLEMDDGDKFAV